MLTQRAGIPIAKLLVSGLERPQHGAGHGERVLAVQAADGVRKNRWLPLEYELMKAAMEADPKNPAAKDFFRDDELGDDRDHGHDQAQNSTRITLFHRQTQTGSNEPARQADVHDYAARRV